MKESKRRKILRPWKRTGFKGDRRGSKETRKSAGLKMGWAMESIIGLEKEVL